MMEADLYISDHANHSHALVLQQMQLNMQAASGVFLEPQNRLFAD